MGRLSKTEGVARGLLAHYLPSERPIYNLRPDWLINPSTGNKLELDIFYPSLQIAIEIDGIQHGRYIAGMQKDFAVFTEQQARDAAKIEQCQALGITLYKLDIFDLTQARFEPFMRGLMMRLGKYEQFRRTTPPKALYAEAKRLSEQQFHPKVTKQLSLWQRLWPFAKRPKPRRYR